MIPSEPTSPVEGPVLAPDEVILAIDVGGTDTKSALLDSADQLQGIKRRPTVLRSGEAGDTVVENVVAILAEYRAAWPHKRVRAIGLIAPGLVDERKGVGIFSANLGWRDYPFTERVEAATGLPVTFGHDVGAAGDAEIRIGAAQGLADVVVMIIGTGVAGAVFCGGQRILGGGYAGEIGHAEVPGGEPCRCGAHGCLETVGAAGAIARRYTERSGRQVNGAREVLQLQAAGDAHAQAIVDDAVNALAFSICQLAATLGTEAVVIGGGLAQAGEQLFTPLRAAVDERLSFHRRPRLLAASMGQDAGLIGAGLQAQDLLGARP
ncbi:ROK family protein [Arthrobacter tecti]